MVTVKVPVVVPLPGWVLVVRLPTTEEGSEMTTVNVGFCAWVVASRLDCEILESCGVVEFPGVLKAVVKVLAADTLVA